METTAEAAHSAAADTKRLLDSDSGQAELRARAILADNPASPEGQFALGAALRRKGDAKEARAMLEPLLEVLPRSAELRMELGRALGELGEHRLAVAVLSQAVKLSGTVPDGWRALAEQLYATGDRRGSEAAFLRASISEIANSRLREAVAASKGRNLDALEDLLLSFLESEPDDAHALNLLAEIALTGGRPSDAEALLERCLDLAPGFAGARYNYASALVDVGKTREAIQELEALLKQDPRNPFYRTLMGDALMADGQLDETHRWREALVRDFPRQPRGWMGLGETLGAMRRKTESAAAFRTAIELNPAMGEAWWALANHSDFGAGASEIVRMEAQLARPDLPSEDRILFHFALGKAFGALQRYEESFENYRRGNAMRRAAVRYDADKASMHVSNCKAFFTRKFFDERRGAGCTDAAPIFIVGLPRSGSSLIEQILASHPDIEGAGELPYITMLAIEIHDAYPGSRYPDVLAMLDPGELKALGEKYLQAVRDRRKSGTPLFTDKAPRNYVELGLIRAILPNARVIDARRHPLGCGFSNFSQNYTGGQVFTYDLTDLGRQYRNYVELMAHYDEVLSGWVYRVFYEDLVGNPERELRRLLDHLGLPFADECLRFHESERYVRTASAEQVRLPIYGNAVEFWRNYEPWLDPLKEALGSVLAAYPDVPTDLK